MDPGRLVPTPDAIPVPWGIFKVLLLATFLLHLVAMNLALGHALLAVWRGIAGRNGRRREPALPTLIAWTVATVPRITFPTYDIATPQYWKLDTDMKRWLASSMQLLASSASFKYQVSSF